MAVFREVLFLTLVFSLHLASCRIGYVPLELFDEDVSVQNLDREGNEVGFLNQEQPTEEEIIACARLIAENGLRQSLSQCQSVTDAIVAYCKDPQSQNWGSKATEVNIPCGEILAAVYRDYMLNIIEQRKKDCSLNGDSGACFQAEPPAKRPKILNCKSTQREGQIPGGSIAKKCIDINRNTESSTVELSISKLNLNPPSSSLVKVYTIPIGQGDCNIITCNGGKNVILFDCGTTGGSPFTGRKRRQLLHSHFDKATSVYVLLSHGHSDHYNNIRKVLTRNEFKIKKVIFGGREADYQDNNGNIISSLRWLEPQVEFLSRSMTMNFCSNSDIIFDLMPGSSTSSNKNEKGMMMKLSCKKCQSSLLFAADMEGPTALGLASSNAANVKQFLSSTHYKMAHHGAWVLANKPKWLQAIRPVEVHISHKYNGVHHHPRCEAVDEVMQLNSVGVTKKSHKFACMKQVSNTNQYSVIEQDVYHRVFSTAPRANTVCLIVMSFQEGSKAETEYYCGKPTEF